MNAPIVPNPNRIDLDEAYMQMAEIWGKRSKANRLQVGALIVKDKQIISDGYNGMPAGDVDDTCEYWHFDGNRDREPGYTGELRTKPEVLHAESNALMKISENGGVGAQGATLYTVYSPCFECSKLIKQAKVKRVVFRHWYRDRAGVDVLLKRGVKVEQLAAEPSAPIADPQPQPAPVAEAPQLNMLKAVTASPQPRAPVEAPAPPPVNPNEPVIIDDVNAALAAAGITLVNGVPVEVTQTQTKAKTAPVDDGSYKSSFF